MDLITNVSEIIICIYLAVIFSVLIELKYSIKRTFIILFVYIFTAFPVYFKLISMGNSDGFSSAVVFSAPSMLLCFFLSKYRDSRFIFTFCSVDIMGFIIVSISRAIGILFGDNQLVVFLLLNIGFASLLFASLKFRERYLQIQRTIISEKVKERFPEGYLMWIDSVAISPNGEYVVYRTNRDSASLNETSLWKISLSSGTEEQFVAPAINNDIVGFITDNDAVVGALKDTRIIDVTDNKVVTIKTPELPNFCVKSVKAGKIVISSYEDGSSDTTTYIDNVNEVTGAMSEITKVSGYLDGEPQFAPSGNKLAIGYGTDAMVGVNDVMVVDVANNVQSLLTDSIPTAKGAHTINSTITRCLWINDDTLLVDTQQENTLPAVESAPPTALVTNPYDIVFGNTPPSIVNFNSPLSTTSTSGFVAVNSKWNQPRNVNGSNPHNGVDLQAALNTNVYAPYPGWATGITGAGPYDIQFLVDANKNGVQDDGDYYIRFYHLNYLITISYQQNNSVNVPPTQFICVGVQNLI